MYGIQIAHTDVNPLVRDLIQQIHDNGEMETSNNLSWNANKPIKELLNSQLVLVSPRSRIFKSNVSNIFNPGLAVARFFYLLSGSNRLASILAYTQGVQKYSDDGVTVPGSAYGFRLFDPIAGNAQFEQATKLILERPNTKRAAMAIYQPIDCGRMSNDIPCALNVVFSPRGNTLHTSVLMRANDAYRAIPYNIFEFSLLGEFMASRTGMQLGNYFHSSVSMHLRGDGITDSLSIVQENIEPLSMNPMPKVTENTRSTLLEKELEISNRMQFLSGSSVGNLIKNIISEHDEYWADFLIVLVLQRCFFVHSKLAISKILDTVSLSPNWPLTNCWLDFYHKWGDAHTLNL